MSLSKEEMLELAEKHNGHVVMPDSQWAKTEAGVTFAEVSDFLAYTSAIEEKYQAQIAMLRDALKYEHEWHVSIEGAAGGKFKPFASTLQALSDTQAAADAFMAEVKAAALEEAGKEYRKRFAWQSNQSHAAGFEKWLLQYAAELRNHKERE